MQETSLRDPRIGEIADLSRALFMQQARSLLARPDNAEALAQETRKKAAALRAEQEALLVSAGLPADSGHG